MSEAASRPSRYEGDAGFERLVADQLRERSRPSGEHAVAVVRSRATRRFQLEAEADGFAFRSDESRHGGGDATGPAPLRYFVAGVLLCLEVWCIKMAAVLHVEISRLEGEGAGMVEAGTRADPIIGPQDARGLSRLRCALVVDTRSATDDQVREVVRQAAYRCPAAATVARAVPLEIEIVHNGVGLGRLELDEHGG